MNPFFSIIIPLYNKEKYIKCTIESILNQIFKDFEIIIVNDGSTDDSYNIVKKIPDDRIRLFSNRNKGLSFSRNYGIKKAKTNYIAFLDADDIWRNDFLDSVFKLITIYKDSLVFATNYSSFFENQKLKLNSERSIDNENELVTNYFERQKNLYASSSLVCHKSVFESIGFFNEDVNYGEEEDFAIRCFSKYQLAYCKTVKAHRLEGIENQLTAPNKNNKRVIPNYDIFLKDNLNIDLKKYIDFIYYKLLILYKMERNREMVNFYKLKISSKNLNFIQQIKFHLPISVFYFLKTIYLKLFRS